MYIINDSEILRNGAVQNLCENETLNKKTEWQRTFINIVLLDIYLIARRPIIYIYIQYITCI